MTRWAFIAALATVATSEASELSTSANDFQKAYNLWVRTVNDEPAGTINAAAYTEWRAAKEAFRALEHLVEQETPKA